MIVELIQGENDEVILPLPDELLLNCGWRIGDEIEFFIECYGIEMNNISRLEIAAEGLRENVDTLLSRIQNESDALNRIVVTKDGRQ